MKYKQWLDKIIYLQTKVILPDGTSLDKGRWVKSDGFDTDGFNEFLGELYNTKYKEDEE